MEHKKTFDLTKKFRFETAHRLALGYVGKCSNLHGHSWNGSVTIRCHKLDKQGMGIDFAIVKKLITQKVEATFDHKTVLHKEDHALIEALRKEDCQVVTTEDNPTSEVIAAFIFDLAKRVLESEGLEENCQVLKVTIDETCTSSCEVTEESSYGV